MLKPSVTENFVVPAGYVYFDREDAAGALTGERYIGQTPGFTVTVASPDAIDLYSSDGPIAELLSRTITKVTRSAKMTCQNVSADNVAAFLIGSVGTGSTSAGTVLNEPITVKKGLWYQLGVSDTDPAGVRDVTSVVITNTAGTTTYVAGTDYLIDLELARFLVVSAGAITDGQIVHVDYTKQARSWERIVSAATGAVFGAVRVVSDNTTGLGRDWYFPRVQLAPDGELALKSRDAYQEIGWSMELQQRQVGSVKRAQVYVDGRQFV